MNTFDQWESDIRGYCRMFPTVFKSASNARQTDESGREYIDFFAGAGVLNFGHNNPRMKTAIIDYISNDGVAHSLDMSTSAKRAFIEKFVETILKPRDWNYKLQFMGPTGTNAVEAALKLARRVTGRQEIVAFSQGFHGMTLGSLACTANSYFRNASGIPLQHVRHQPFGCERRCVGCEQGCGIESVRQLRALYENTSSGLEKPAAFILEPIQAEGGVRVASEEWLRAIQDLAHDLGALFIIDDIQAGCGRTGPFFSFDGMDLQPDIITLAKGLGGFGTPIAMNLVNPEHDKHWSPGEHTGTFRGQNLSFIAGIEALKYFDDDTLLQSTLAKGRKMQDALEAIVAKFPDRALDIRGKGMMQALDVYDGDVAKAITRDCFENGLLFSPCGAGGRILKLIPPLTIDYADLEAGLEIFTTATIRNLEKAA